MKKRKLTALLAALAMTVGILSGCGAKGEKSEPADSAPAADDASAAQEDGEGESGQETASAGEAQAITIWY